MSPSSAVPPSSPSGNPSRKSAFDRFLNGVEWLGNLLPHPVTLFAILCLFILLMSGLLGALDVAVADPRPEGAPGRADNGMIEVVSLLNAVGLRRIIENLVHNFASFVPLGTVLVAMLGVGVAERSGLISAAIRSLVLRAPKRLVTMALVFAGVMSNTAAEMGYVVLIPLGAAIFHSLGRHPIAGLAAAFAGVSGGYSANLLLGTVDPLLAGITEAAARIIDPEYVVHPAVNWYFMVTSTFVVTIVGAWVTQSIIEPRLGTYDRSQAADQDEEQPRLEALTDVERKGLRWAGLSALALTALVLWATLPANGALRLPGAESTISAITPLLRGVVALVFVFFLIPGFVYGRITGSMKNDRDVIDAMAKSMGTMGLYIVLVFFAAQFVAFFNWSQLGQVTAVVGAQLLKDIGLTGPLVFLPFIVMCMFINLSLGSASAQWAMTAPIFVPMLMLVGYSPEVIQAGYRIGDSTTNIITPMMSYFGLILAFATKYVKDLGIGTLIATMLPYSIAFSIGWTIWFFIWVFLLGMPVGPGAPTYYPAP